MTLGNVSIAVPIADSSDRVFAAVSLVLHSARADVRRFVPLLRRAAAGISETLAGYSTEWD